MGAVKGKLSQVVQGDTTAPQQWPEEEEREGSAVSQGRSKAGMGKRRED